MLHVEKDAAGGVVVAQEVDDVPEVHIYHVAQGGEHAEAYVRIHGPFQHGVPQLAALGDEGYVAQAGVARRKLALSPYFRPDDAEGGGAYDPYACKPVAAAATFLSKPLTASPFSARSAAIMTAASGPGPAALFHDGRHKGRGDDYNGEIDGTGKGAYGGAVTGMSRTFSLWGLTQKTFCAAGAHQVHEYRLAEGAFPASVAPTRATVFGSSILCRLLTCIRPASAMHRAPSHQLVGSLLLAAGYLLAHRTISSTMAGMVALGAVMETLNPASSTAFFVTGPMTAMATSLR